MVHITALETGPTMKTLIALLIFANLLAHSAVHGTCEQEATAPLTIVKRYLGLVNIGLSRQALTLDDLRWASHQPEPTSPLRQGRNAETLSLRDGFASILKRFDANDWTSVQSALKEKIANANKESQTIDEAKVETAPIYNWVPQPLRTSGEIIAQLTTKNGEFAFVSRHLNATDIFVGDSHVQIPFTSNLADIFETSKGQIAVSFISEKAVKIVDARTGKIIFDRPLENFKTIKDSGISLDAKFRAILYESPKRKGSLMAVVTPFQLDPRTAPGKLPVVIVNITSECIEREMKSPNELSFERLSNGHVYAYGKSRAANQRGTLITLIDITTDKVHFRRYYKGGQSLKNFYSILSLSQYDKPHIYFVANFNTSAIFDFDPAMRRVFRVQSLENTVDAQIILDSQGRKYVLGFEDRTNFANMILQPLDPIESERRIRVPKDVANSASLAIIPSLNGELLLLVQYSHVGSVILHVFEMKTEHRTSIKLNAHSLETPFFNPANGRLYVFNILGNNELSPRQLYQFWGPTR